MVSYFYATISTFKNKNVANPPKMVLYYISNLLIMSTSLKPPLSSIPKVAILKKFYCNRCLNIPCVSQLLTQAMFYRLF